MKWLMPASVVVTVAGLVLVVVSLAANLGASLLLTGMMIIITGGTAIGVVLVLRYLVNHPAVDSPPPRLGKDRRETDQTR